MKPTAIEVQLRAWREAEFDRQQRAMAKRNAVTHRNVTHRNAVTPTVTPTVTRNASAERQARYRARKAKAKAERAERAEGAA
jgi:hypothetical protein